MATSKKDGTSQPSRSRKAPEKSGSKSASRSATKKGTAASKRAQPKAMAGSPVRGKVPNGSGQISVRRRIAHGDQLAPRHIAVTFDNPGPPPLARAAC